MSEHTNRVDLSRNPASTLRWRASIVRLSDGAVIQTFETSMGREEAFARALAYVTALRAGPEPDHSVYLSEDGDLLDPHEAGVLRDANA